MTLMSKKCIKNLTKIQYGNILSTIPYMTVTGNCYFSPVEMITYTYIDTSSTLSHSLYGSLTGLKTKTNTNVKIIIYMKELIY